MPTLNKVSYVLCLMSYDLPENIRSSVRLFADDCVLYRNIESPIDSRSGKMT